MSKTIEIQLGACSLYYNNPPGKDNPPAKYDVIHIDGVPAQSRPEYDVIQTFGYAGAKMERELIYELLGLPSPYINRDNRISIFDDIM